MEGRALDNMEIKKILSSLPYGPEFLFVDGLHRVDEEGAEGYFTFRKDKDYFKGHFRDQPVTPGVLLTECCAQIGLVCLGIFLGEAQGVKAASLALSSTEMQFFLPVLPGEMVLVRSRIHYFRFNKLKCGVRMYNQQSELVCKGLLSGMLIPKANE